MGKLSYFLVIAALLLLSYYFLFAEKEATSGDDKRDRQAPSPRTPPIQEPIDEDKEEAPIIPDDLLYTFGAKFEPPEGMILHGMGQFPKGNADYLSVLGNEITPMSSLFFSPLADGLRPWPTTMETLKNYLAKEKSAGRIPHVSLSMHSGGKPSGSTDKYFAIDEEIAGSTKHDEHIMDVIQLIKDYKNPVFVRIGHEFSGSWNGYEPYEYPKAFQKIVTMFRDAGVDNAAFIWAYQPIATDDFDLCDPECRWFPGDEYIDWYGLDVFDHSEFTQISGSGRDGGTTQQAYQRSLHFLQMAKSHKKPVMLAETSAKDASITSSQSDGMKDWGLWFEPFFSFIEDHEVIKGFYYININWSSTGFGADGWTNANIKDNSYIAEEYVKEMKKQKYLHLDQIHFVNKYAE